jgi:leucyl-tRNA synthetase
MFMGPFEQAIAWSEASLVGPRRFIERVWRLSQNLLQTKSSDDFAHGQTLPDEASTLMHQTIKKISDDIESMSFNTAVSTLMIYTSALEKREAVSQKEYETLILLLAPFAPFVTEALWSALGHKNSVHTEPWPTYDQSKLIKLTSTYAVQINGKVRATVETSSQATEDEVKNLAMALPEVTKWLNGATPKKVIIVLGKVVNIVV